MQKDYPLHGGSDTSFYGDLLEWAEPILAIVEQDDRDYYIGSYTEDADPHNGDTFAVDDAKIFAIPHGAIDRSEVLDWSGLNDSRSHYAREQLIGTIVRPHSELKAVFISCQSADTYNLDYFNWNWRGEYSFTVYINNYLCIVPSHYFSRSLPF